MSGETEVRAAEPETDGDTPALVHWGCCHDDGSVGPSLCGTPIDDPTAPVEEVDQQCVVCDDLFTADPMLCPRFGRCESESFG